MSPRSIRDNNENVVTPYTVTPQEGLENVIEELGYDTEVTYNDGRDPEAAAKLAAESDVVLLMIGDNPHETVDRDTLGFPAIDLDKHPDRENFVEQEPLIDAVLEANAENTAVVLKLPVRCLCRGWMRYQQYLKLGSQAWRMEMPLLTCFTVKSILLVSCL